MKDWQSQAHVKWDCKSHVVILPKYRRKVLYGRLRRGIGQILRDLCRQKDIELVEGKAMPDHIHMLLSVPPRYSIAMTIGYLKGKSATRIHRELLHTKGTWIGRSFWARVFPSRQTVVAMAEAVDSPAWTCCWKRSSSARSSNAIHGPYTPKDLAVSGQGWGGATLKPDPAPARGTMGATFSDRPSVSDQRYVFRVAVTIAPF